MEKKDYFKRVAGSSWKKSTDNVGAPLDRQHRAGFNMWLRLAAVMGELHHCAAMPQLLLRCTAAADVTSSFFEHCRRRKTHMRVL